MRPIIIALFMGAALNTAHAEETGGFDVNAYLKAEQDKKAADMAKSNAEWEAKQKIIRKKKQAAAKAKAEREMLPENVAKKSDEEICLLAGKAYQDVHFKGMEVWGKEAQRRQKLRLKYVDNIQNETVALGMNECELYASLGKPDRANRTVNIRGTHIQYVYGRTYIYTDNGIVTSWQD